MNFEIPNLQIKNFEENSNKSASIKSLEIDTSQLSDKQEKINGKELLDPKNLNNNDTSDKNENDNNDLNQLNSKEKNIITVDLTSDEKIVFSQLGINPLIKLGKEFLTSNNFVLLNDKVQEKEKRLDNKKPKTKQIQKISKSKEEKENEISIKANVNSKDKSTKKTNDNKEVVFLDKKSEIELKDDTNNARKKRRRSSASIE